MFSNHAFDMAWRWRNIFFCKKRRTRKIDDGASLFNFVIQLPRKKQGKKMREKSISNDINCCFASSDSQEQSNLRLHKRRRRKIKAKKMSSHLCVGHAPWIGYNSQVFSPFFTHTMKSFEGFFCPSPPAKVVHVTVIKIPSLYIRSHRYSLTTAKKTSDGYGWVTTS